MGNSHLPIAKTASVTVTIVYVIFGFFHLIYINFLLMASRNVVIFAIFVGFVNKKRGFHNFAVSSRAFYCLICISLLFFVDGPAKNCNFLYFRGFRNN